MRYPGSGDYESGGREVGHGSSCAKNGKVFRLNAFRIEKVEKEGGVRGGE